MAHRPAGLAAEAEVEPEILLGGMPLLAVRVELAELLAEVTVAREGLAIQLETLEHSLAAEAEAQEIILEPQEQAASEGRVR